MKKINIIVTCASLLILFFTGCKKESKETKNSALDTEKNSIKNALQLAQAYNDTLKIGFDSSKIHKYHSFCLNYDSLYHRNDTMFTMHYAMFCEEMHKKGMMSDSTSDYMVSGGMMNGSSAGSVTSGNMMNNSGGMMEMESFMADTTEVNGYYRAMHLLHKQHKPYHDSIYK